MLSLRFKVLAFFALAATVLAGPAPSAAPAPASAQKATGVLYLMTNNEEENAIVMHHTFADGSIRYANTVGTGQKGAANLLVPAGPDSIRSAQSILVHEDMLFQVNPGSDTVSMWKINPQDPTQIRLVGRPVNTGGEFPGAVTVSKNGKRACVSNGGHINGVQCYNITDQGLKVIPNTRRLLNFIQITPPAQSDYLNSMSTVFFNEDETKLLVDVKGLTIQKVPGYFAAWDVNKDGSLSESHETFPAQSDIGSIPFGVARLPGKDGYVAADASIGGVIFDFSEGFSKEKMKTKNFVLPGQGITCWSTYASKSDTYFMTDFGHPQLFEAKVDPNSLDVQIVQRFDLPNNTVNIDTLIVNMDSNQYLYQLAPFGSTVFTFDVQPNGMTKQAHAYNFSRPLTKDNVKFTIYSPAGLGYHPIVKA